MCGLLPWLGEYLLCGLQNSDDIYRFLLGSRNFYWPLEMSHPSQLQEVTPGFFRCLYLSRRIASSLEDKATQFVGVESHTGFTIEMRSTLFYLSRCVR